MPAIAEGWRRNGGRGACIARHGRNDAHVTTPPGMARPAWKGAGDQQTVLWYGATGMDQRIKVYTSALGYMTTWGADGCAGRRRLPWTRKATSQEMYLLPALPSIDVLRLDRTRREDLVLTLFTRHDLEALGLLQVSI